MYFYIIDRSLCRLYFVVTENRLRNWAVQATVIIDVFSYKAISYEEYTQAAGIFVHFPLHLGIFIAGCPLS